MGCYSARAAITKYHRLAGGWGHEGQTLKRQRFSSLSVRSWKVSAQGVSSIAFIQKPLSWRRLPPAVSSHGLSPMWAHAHILLLSSSCKDTSHIGLRPILVTSFYWKYLFKGPISSHSGVLGVRTSTWEFGGTQCGPYQMDKSYPTEGLGWPQVQWWELAQERQEDEWERSSYF